MDTQRKKITILKDGVFFAMTKKIIITLVFCVVITCIGYYAWQPGSSSDRIFDPGENGIWVGHKWYTGFDVRTEKPVSLKEMREFIDTLKRSRIKYVYIHAGPINNDGSINDYPGNFFRQLRAMNPEIIYLPWLGGNAHRLPLDSAAWRGAFMETIGKLHVHGFSGIHLDIEPLRNYHPGYKDLLQEIRNQFEGKFFISQATRRLAPFGLCIWPVSNHFWSKGFYKVTMEHCDQTVLMGYDTCLKLQKLYIGYIKQQTKVLISCAAEVPNHSLLIGIPSYEDMAQFSDPKIENIRNASLGVRGALEDLPLDLLGCFKGVSIYSFWVTDSLEWDQYHRYWLSCRDYK